MADTVAKIASLANRSSTERAVRAETSDPVSVCIGTVKPTSEVTTYEEVSPTALRPLPETTVLMMIMTEPSWKFVNCHLRVVLTT